MPEVSYTFVYDAMAQSLFPQDQDVASSSLASSSSSSLVQKRSLDFYGDARFGRRGKNIVEGPRCIVCGSENVARRCETCVKFDPRGGGYYCSSCFPIRHPSYRVPHASTDIKQSEDLRLALESRDQRRQIVEVRDALVRCTDQLTKPQQALSKMDHDTNADDKMKSAIRRDAVLSQRLIRMRRALGFAVSVRDSHDDDNGLVIPTKTRLFELDPDHAAAAFVQRRWRGHQARLTALKLLEQRFQKFIDECSGFYYFVDLHTNFASWEPPRLLWGSLATSSDLNDAIHQAADRILSPRSHEAKFGSSLPPLIHS